MCASTPLAASYAHFMISTLDRTQLDEGTGSQRNRVIVRQALQRCGFVESQAAVPERVHAQPLESTQGLVGMHQRKSERIGNMLLIDRKLGTVVPTQAG